MGETAPSFPLYVRDWIVSTMPMTDEQAGAYMKLLCHAWEARGLPVKERDIQAIGRWSPAAWRRIWPAIASKWVERNGRLVNERLERERACKGAYRGSAETAARAKWGDPYPGHANRSTRSQRLKAARTLGVHTHLEWLTMLTAYGCCLRCGASEPLVKDHVIPIYQGGSDHITNIQVLCRTCNNAKGPERIDYRVGHPKTCQEWLPNGSATPAETPAPQASERLPNASFSSSFSSAEHPKNPLVGGTNTPVNGFGPLRRHPLDPVDGVDATIELSERANAWLERFYTALERHSGVPEPRRRDRDFTPAKSLVATYSDLQLEALVDVYLVASGPKFDGIPKSPGRLLDAAGMIAAQLRKAGQWPSAA